jgi:hypothetical protein
MRSRGTPTICHLKQSPMVAARACLAEAFQRRRIPASGIFSVIASKAKQSLIPLRQLQISQRLLRFARNDGKKRYGAYQYSLNKTVRSQGRERLPPSGMMNHRLTKTTRFMLSSQQIAFSLVDNSLLLRSTQQARVPLML